MSANSAPQTVAGPPYAPPSAQLGGTPSKKVDIPIASVFLLLFIGCAIGHMTIFKLNLRKGHKFFFSAMIFGYCMCRVSSMVLRIVWACYPDNVRLSIAAQVFIAAGVLLLYVINLFFAQRIIRACHPNFGWSKAFSSCFFVLYGSIPVVLAMIITVTIQSYYTLDPRIQKIDRDVRFGAISYLLFFSVLPIPLLLLNFILPAPLDRKVEHFGTGHWQFKVLILLVATLLLVTGTAWRTAVAFLPTAPVNSPAWYHSKACFWIFNVGVELIVAYLYIFVRVDQKFYVSDGASGPGSYSVESIRYLTEDPYAQDKDKDIEQSDVSARTSRDLRSKRASSPSALSAWEHSMDRTQQPPQMLRMTALRTEDDAQQVVDDRHAVMSVRSAAPSMNSVQEESLSTFATAQAQDQSNPGEVVVTTLHDETRGRRSAASADAPFRGYVQR